MLLTGTPHPPAGQAAALAVAVEQGTRTLDTLAAIQVPARCWFFWRD